MTKSIFQDYKLSKRSFFLMFFLVVGLLGGIMNLTVMVNNGSKMPVYYKNIQFETDKHFSYADKNQINYPILSDFIKINDDIYSIGDIFIYFSLFSSSINIVLLIKRAVEVNNANKKGKV